MGSFERHWMPKDVNESVPFNAVVASIQHARRPVTAGKPIAEQEAARELFLREKVSVLMLMPVRERPRLCNCLPTVRGSVGFTLLSIGASPKTPAATFLTRSHVRRVIP